SRAGADFLGYGVAKPGIDAVEKLLVSRFTDQSKDELNALANAAERSWKILEIALDGHFTSPRAVVSRVAAVGAERVEESVESLWTGAKPGSAETLLASCLAERSGANQRLPGVGP